MGKFTAVASPNIAFVKYWGQSDGALNLPANPSLSMNLAELTTVTTAEFEPGLGADVVTIDGQEAVGQPLVRVSRHLDQIRELAGIDCRARVASQSNFPAGTGLASSAAAFAALSLAATRAADLDLSEAALSRLARLGSGSACRSVPGGFSLWTGHDDASSYARQVAPPEHWDLVDVIAVVTEQAKAVSSHDGHRVAPTSPLYAARLAAVPALLCKVQAGIHRRNLGVMGPAIEADALAMHAVMMTSRPSLLYWQPQTVAVLLAVRTWREEGLEVFFTIDAGPNVHCLCVSADTSEVAVRLKSVPDVKQVLASGPGAGVRPSSDHLF